jgi:hypothetical protein
MSNPVPTLNQKVALYEALLHRIQLNAEVLHNEQIMSDLIKNICDWSYAHRVGNGEIDEDRVEDIINSKFWKLLQTRSDKTDLSTFYKNL